MSIDKALSSILLRQPSRKPMHAGSALLRLGVDSTDAYGAQRQSWVEFSTRKLPACRTYCTNRTHHDLDRVPSRVVPSDIWLGQCLIQKLPQRIFGLKSQAISVTKRDSGTRNYGQPDFPAED
jgi:hypothetical protein